MLGIFIYLRILREYPGLVQVFSTILLKKVVGCCSNVWTVFSIRIDSRCTHALGFKHAALVGKRG